MNDGWVASVALGHPWPRVSIWRYLTGGGVLCISILIAPALTIWNLTVHTNACIGWLQWLFVVAMAPEVLKAARTSLASSLAFRVLVFGFLVCAVGWLAQGLRIGEIDRTSFYVVQPLFVFAACAWFRWAGELGLRTVYHAKLWATIGAVVYLFAMLWLASVPDLDWRQAARLPIYRNIRHLGYDLAVVASLGALFWVARPHAYRIANWLLFGGIGYVSLWAAGRGQILAWICFVALATNIFSHRIERKSMVAPFVAYCMGGLVLWVTAPDLVSWLFGRSITGSIDSVSAGRIQIWLDTLALASADWPNGIVGLGPDAFTRHGVARGLVQPHNSILQALLEFGLVGVIVVCVLMADFLGRIGLLLRDASSSVMLRGAIAATWALMLYSLVDGIFYHASPFLACMLLIAFILSRHQDSLSKDPVPRPPSKIAHP